MSLRIRELEIRVATQNGVVGTNLSFSDGLNVIAAKNSRGKSTCLMSILYALGLEGMLGPSHTVPLTDAMQRTILIGGDEIPVLDSHVRLEIENHDGVRFTASRKVTATNKDRQLIRGVFGPDISRQRKDYERKDFYVRAKGAAQGNSGFHRFLAEFCGLELPNVPGTESDVIPLYLETLFPFFFVDQMTGWRDIKSRMPTYLRIPEMAKRSMEYILDLDILKRAITRLKLEQELSRLKLAWSKEINAAKTELATGNVVLRSLPDSPQALWPPSPSPQAFVSDGEDWIELGKGLKNIRKRQKEIVDDEIPRAEQVSQDLIDELGIAEEKFAKLDDRHERATRDLFTERKNVLAINKRLEALEEDLKDYLDLKRVLDRGGDVELEVAGTSCPTCHQTIKDTLLPQDQSSSPMSLEENIAFIKDQIATFVQMRYDAIEVFEAKQRQRGALGDRMRRQSSEIRSLKRTLRADGEAPSAAAIREHLSLDDEAERLEGLSDRFRELESELSGLSKSWVQADGELKKLVKLGLSDRDDVKMQLLQKSFLKQLTIYGFSSFLTDRITINRDSYRPNQDGHDIGLTSASDTIRIIWAHLLGLLEVDQQKQTNHLGLLILDEPRQQGADKVSFDTLLIRAAQSKKFGQQVIFATSEDRAPLEEVIGSLECEYRYFNEKILEPIATQ